MKDQDKVRKGRTSRAQGKLFELRVRKDLEEKGWTVDRWTSNVELTFMTKGPEIETVKEDDAVKIIVTEYEKLYGKIVAAKSKWAGPGRPMMMGAGFPDFIAFRDANTDYLKTVIGVECKMTGKLDEEEKEKCRWYLDNNIFVRISIAVKIKSKNKIVIEYRDFEEYYSKLNSEIKPKATFND